MDRKRKDALNAILARNGFVENPTTTVSGHKVKAADFEGLDRKLAEFYINSHMDVFDHVELETPARGSLAAALLAKVKARK